MHPSTVDPLEESARLKRYNRRLIGGMVVLLILGVAAIPVFWHWQAQKRWEKTKAAWERDIGTLEFYELLPESIPDEDNFFAIPELAGIASREKNPAGLLAKLEGFRMATPDRTTTASTGLPMTQDEVQHWYDALVVEGALPSLAKESNEPAKAILEAIDQLHLDGAKVVKAAGEKSSSQLTPAPLDREWPENLLSSGTGTWWSSSQNLVRLMNARGRAALHSRRSDEAMASLEVIFHCVEATKWEPFLISRLISITLEHQAWALVQEGLAMDSWNTDQSGRIIAWLQKLDADASLRYTIQTGASAIVSADPLMFLGSGASPTLPQALGISVPHNRTQQLSLFRLLAELPPEDGNAAWPMIGKIDALKTDWRSTFLNRWVNQIAIWSFGGFRSIGKEALRQVALRKHVRIGLALAAFGRYKDAAPTLLTALVPDYLERIPVDPIDGKPMRYLRLPDGYQLWSIGMDGKDDGGDEDKDWLWQVQKPEPKPKSETRIISRRRILIPPPQFSK